MNTNYNKMQENSNNQMKESIELVIDGQNRKINCPLIANFPSELREYLVFPNAHGTEVIEAFKMKRNSCQQFLHSLAASILFPWSLLKMVLVKDGELGLTWYGDQPEILPPGRHVLLAPTNILKAKVKMNARYIEHGTLFIIRVAQGELGFGMDRETGNPVFLTTGRHVIKSSTFVFKRFISLTDRVTDLEQLKIIRIETGNVGCGYKAGKLHIFEPGLHLIRPPDRFDHILTTQLTILDLPNSVQETSDYVPLQVRAGVFYRVVDPLKALTQVQNIRKQIEDTAVATLAGIIRASSLADVAQGSNPVYKKSKHVKLNMRQEESKEEARASAPPFYQYIHDEFMQKLHDHVLVNWGIEIQNIRIEQLKIANNVLATKISNQAVAVSQQHNEYLMLQKKTDIVTVEANNKATQLQIAAEAEALAIKTRAQAKANEIVIRARAEKEALELKAQAESIYAERLGKTELGKILSCQKIQAESLKGINKMVYVPHLPSLMKDHGVYPDTNLIMPNQQKN